MIFKDEDSGLADNCLAHARDLYDFAINYKAKYSDSSPQGWFSNLHNEFMTLKWTILKDKMTPEVVLTDSKTFQSRKFLQFLVWL